MFSALHIYFLLLLFCRIAVYQNTENQMHNAVKLRPHQFFTVFTATHIHITNNTHVCKAIQFTFMAHLYYYQSTIRVCFAYFFFFGAEKKEIFWSIFDDIGFGLSLSLQLFFLTVLIYSCTYYYHTHDDSVHVLVRKHHFNVYILLYDHFHHRIIKVYIRKMYTE